MTNYKKRGRDSNGSAGLQQPPRKGMRRSISTSNVHSIPAVGANNASATGAAAVPAAATAATGGGGNKAMKGNKQSGKDLKDATEEVEEEDDDTIDQHPYKLGHYLQVKYRDGSERYAKIIERTNAGGENDSFGGNSMVMDDSKWQYYIHYNDFNRRMDEWIDIERIISPPSVANPICKALEASHGAHPVGAASAEETTKVNDDDNQKTINGPTTVADLEHDEHEGLDEASLREHEELTKVKNIKYVQLGRHIMECWYFSPFPKEFYPNGFHECLFFCEFSMRFFRTKQELLRYQRKPNLPRHPPGNEIYRDDNVSMFELDGAVEKIYCQNLCYFAKLFLDHKTLYWDVDPFLFYVLCTRDSRGFHPVGYFSKEKYSDMGYNLACILTFPCVQRMGFGRFLIAFSYELSKKEEKAGSPEKPLSDLGAVGYRSYWAHVLLKLLKDHKSSEISILDLTRKTSILPDDVAATLHYLGILRETKESDDVEQVSYVFYAPKEFIEQLLLKYPAPRITVDPEKLHWAPLYVTDAKKDKWSLKHKREWKDPLGGSTGGGGAGYAGGGYSSGAQNQPPQDQSLDSENTIKKTSSMINLPTDTNLAVKGGLQQELVQNMIKVKSEPTLSDKNNQSYGGDTNADSLNEPIQAKSTPSADVANVMQDSAVTVKEEGMDAVSPKDLVNGHDDYINTN